MIGPLCYVGGKHRLADQIIATFPKHITYVEVFGGGLQVFFRKPSSKVEIVNDLDSELINFYRVCQSHHEELLRYMRWMLVGRNWYEHLKTNAPESLTDIQRAARFFYLQKSSFGGKVTGQSYGRHVIQGPRLNIARLPELISETHDRLQNAQIECMSYERLLESYDRSTTLFYLDPPYFERKFYKYNFEPEDFSHLADRLKQLKGKFILSLNDVPEIRRLFDAFTIQSVSLSYSLQKKVGQKFTELLITNFQPNNVPTA
jgi:DNA adenine methylase